jgi:hypothetical protein
MRYSSFILNYRSQRVVPSWLAFFVNVLEGFDQAPIWMNTGAARTVTKPLAHSLFHRARVPLFLAHDRRKVMTMHESKSGSNKRKQVTPTTAVPAVRLGQSSGPSNRKKVTTTAIPTKKSSKTSKGESK